MIKENNILNNNSNYGLFIESGSCNNTIKNNDIEGNTLRGLRITSDNNTIVDNEVMNNPGGGINLYLADNTTVRNNTIETAIDITGKVINFAFIEIAEQRDGPNAITIERRISNSEF